MEYATGSEQNSSFPKFYKENYVVPWSEITPLDEVSIVLLSLCVVLLFATLLILLYAYIEVKGEREMEHAQRLAVIYIHSVLSFIALIIAILSMKPIDLHQRNRGLTTTSFLLLFMISSVTWLMLESLSNTVAIKSTKRRSGMFYVAIGWGIATLIPLIYIGLHFALKEALFDPMLRWFDAGVPRLFLLFPLSALFMVHVISLLAAHSCKSNKVSKQLEKQLVVLRCSTLNTLLMVPLTYSSLIVYEWLLNDYRLLYEYILVCLLSIQSLMMFLWYIIFNPVIKSSLVDSARKDYEYNKDDIPLVSIQPAYVA